MFTKRLVIGLALAALFVACAAEEPAPADLSKECRSLIVQRRNWSFQLARRDQLTEHEYNEAVAKYDYYNARLQEAGCHY